ncbi:DNA-damage-inducible protein J [Gammaproteobacteria bacterium]
MPSPTSILHIRVDTEVKTQAAHTLAAMGLSVADAVRLFLKRVVTDQNFSQELKTPNAITRSAMEESREIMKARCPRFDTADALFNDLEENGTR